MITKLESLVKNRNATNFAKAVLKARSLKWEPLTIRSYLEKRDWFQVASELLDLMNSVILNPVKQINGAGTKL